MDDPEQDRLDDLRTMLGPEAGSLALALDKLTDVMAMVNLHAVYCRVEKGPRAGSPPLDVEEVLKTLETVKDLVKEAIDRLRK